jgi:hypothetical protein
MGCYFEINLLLFRREKVRDSILIVFFLSIATFAGAQQISAQDQGEHTHEYSEQSNFEAFEADLTAMASARGMTAEEARTRVELVDAIGEMQGQILDNPWLARSYAGAEVRDDGTAAVYIKGQRSSFIKARLPADLPVEIVTGQKYSLQELEDRAMQFHTELADIGFNNIVTSFDITTGQVQGMASTDGFDRSSQFRAIGALDATMVMSAMPEHLRSDVEFKLIDGGIAEDRRHAAVGGMEALDDGVFECTIGWPVEEVDGSRTGVTTAGHCNGINQALERPAYGQVNLTHVREHRGEWGDIEWKTTSGAERAQFIADENDSLRNITAVEPVRNMIRGESVCAFGQSSNDRECGMDIRRTSISCTNQGVRNDRLVQMDANLTLIGGDSGGGYSFSTRVYGSDKGACRDPDNGVVYAAFSAADLYDEAIRVRVMTQ